MHLLLFEFKDNLTDSLVWNTGETGDIYWKSKSVYILRQESLKQAKITNNIFDATVRPDM